MLLCQSTKVAIFMCRMAPTDPPPTANTEEFAKDARLVPIYSLLSFLLSCVTFTNNLNLFFETKPWTFSAELARTQSTLHQEPADTTEEKAGSDGGWAKISAVMEVNDGGSAVELGGVEAEMPITISDDEEVKEEVPVDPVRSDFVEDIETSSCDGLGNTSSSSDESAGAECPAKRMVKPPSAPVGYSLVQHSKLKTLHLLPEDRILACGRSKSKLHVSVDLKVRWDTPFCHCCWKKMGG